MSRTSTRAGHAGLHRHVVNGETMGTRYAAVFWHEAETLPEGLAGACFAAVDEVDRQMSLWKPASDLNRLNAAPVGAWIDVPEAMAEVLALALQVSRQSGGLFNPCTGPVTAAWGYGPEGADVARIKALLGRALPDLGEALELDIANGRARRLLPVTLDLNGIAKGYGVDRLFAALEKFGVAHMLVSIDGEVRARGLASADTPWAVALEAPEYGKREARGVIALTGSAVATSGDYRHWVEVGGQLLSHTMDPRTGGPSREQVASASVIAESCALADAWATALMVAGPVAGPMMARNHGLDALLLVRRGDRIDAIAEGEVFAGAAEAA